MLVSALTTFVILVMASTSHASSPYCSTRVRKRHSWHNYSGYRSPGREKGRLPSPLPTAYMVRRVRFCKISKLNVIRNPDFWCCAYRSRRWQVLQTWAPQGRSVQLRFVTKQYIRVFCFVPQTLTKHTPTTDMSVLAGISFKNPSLGPTVFDESLSTPVFLDQIIFCAPSLDFGKSLSKIDLSKEWSNFWGPLDYS